ncbi:MAG: hypothetical protein ACRCVJ_08865 [Clostridium sp.]|uniref:hypothetical protein n=1 Tax=Clostridium sp. TaxID=1506 RepID=UPI003F2F8491
MSEFTEIDIEKIISGEDNMKDFKRFLKEFGIEDIFEDVTLTHIKDRLEVLLAIANEDLEPKISSKKKELKKLLENLKGEKDKRAAMRALREIYSAYSSSDLDEKELDTKLKHSLKEVKKYEHFKKHEEAIAEKWIRDLNKKGNKIETC